MTLLWATVFLGATALRLAWAIRAARPMWVGPLLSLVAALDLVAWLDRVCVLQTPWSPWVLAVLFAALAEAGLWVYREAAGWRGAALRTLRLLATWAVLALVVLPAVEHPPAREDRPTIAVLVDDSASMGITDESDAAGAESPEAPDPATRYQRAVGWWQQQEEAPDSLVARLREHYDVRPLRFSDTLREWPSTNAVPAQLAPAGRTDLGAALDGLLERVGPDALHGVVLLTDGRHTAEQEPSAAVDRYRRRRIPVSTILHGDDRPPLDATWAELRVPETVFEGDQVTVRARLQASGMNGRSLQVRLLQEDEVVDEQEVPVVGDAFHRDLRFAHRPEEAGLYAYRLEVDAVEGERLTDNNLRSFDVAVSDDRVNVLLLDGRPRWEFRYLRNLFHRRDKSVHLQYVLAHPETIDGQPAPEWPPASAARPFGESHAGDLPENEDEWLGFDVIVLGDLPPDRFDEADLEALYKAVVERGALLVMIAGPRHLPHAWEGASFQELLPVDIEASVDAADAPEAFHPALTWTGRTHPALTLEDGADETVWDTLEPLWWRHPGIVGIREGAEVLAWAEPEEGLPGGTVEPDFTIDPESALVVTRRAGLGQVFWLSFDQTWRLRYGVGDRYHHRFWGQVLRWGIGDRLRSGTAQVRLGSDRLAYFPGAEIRAMVRLRDAERRPLNDVEGTWLHLVPADDPEATPTQRVRLRYRPGSSGMYDAALTAPETPGAWRLVPAGKPLKGLLGEEEGESGPFLAFGVRAPDLSGELAQLGVDRDRVEQLARATAGKVVEPGEEESLLPLWLDNVPDPPPPVTHPLWDRWWSLVGVVALWSGEWWLRRRGGFA